MNQTLSRIYPAVIKAFIIFAAFILAGTLAGQATFFGVKPNIVLAAAIAVSFFSPVVEAGVWGILAGALIDLLWGRVFGIHTLLCLYGVLFCKVIEEMIFRRSLLVAVSLTMICEFFYEMVFFFLNFIIWKETRVLFGIVRIILPATVYTGLIQIIIYPAAKGLMRTGQESEMRA